MKKFLRLSSLVTLAFLLIFTSLVPYTTVFAEIENLEDDLVNDYQDSSELELEENLDDDLVNEYHDSLESEIEESIEVNPTNYDYDSIILEPGESIFIERNKNSYTPLNGVIWSHNLKLSSLGGVLGYAFVSTNSGNLLDENGNRLIDAPLLLDWDKNKGGMAYQKHQSSPNLTFFHTEILNITNTSDYLILIEWVKYGENDSLIPPFDRVNGKSDLGLIVEKHDIPAFLEYTIKPNETYKFERTPVKWGYHDGIYVEAKTSSQIFPKYLSQYIATPITNKGSYKFDIAIESYTYGADFHGNSYPPISNTPVVIPDAHNRYMKNKFGTPFVLWTKSRDINEQYGFNEQYIQSMTVKNTGFDDIILTSPYGIVVGERLENSEPMYNEITLKPKERLAYKILKPGNIGSPEITVLGNTYSDNFFTWGDINYPRLSDLTTFTNFETVSLLGGKEERYFLTNVSDHDLKVAYPQEYVELRKVPVYEDINIIASTIKPALNSAHLTASGNKNSLQGDPVDTSTGAFSTVMETLGVQGVSNLSVPLSYYSSFTKDDGLFGKGWETEYSARLQHSAETVKIQWTQNRFSNYVLKDPQGNEYIGSDPSTKHDKLVITNSSRNSGILTKKDGSQWVFEWGSLREIIDRTGKLIRIDYENSEIKSLTDTATGKRIYFKFNKSIPSSVASIYDDMGRRVSFTYNYNNYITSITDPNGKITTFDYSEEGRIISSHDNEGIRVFFNTYDEKGRVVEQEYDGISTFNYTLDEETGHQITEVTNRNGDVKKLHHNTNLKLVKVEDESKGVTESVYDIDGNVIESTDANGNRTFFTYDAKGNVITSKDAKGTITEYDYDSSNNLTSVKAGGIVTGNFLYENNLLKETEDRFNNKTTYTYNDNKQIETITNPDGGITKYTYKDGLLKTITDPTGVVTTYEHDMSGRLVATIDANNNRTELTYDSNNNLVKTKDALGNETTFKYDSRNRKVSQTINSDNTTTFAYDVGNNLISTTDAMGNTVTHRYDLEDRLISTTDALGNKTEFIRDELGQIIGIKDPLGNTISTVYDKVGNILSNKDAYNTVISTFEYDELNRATKVTDALGYTSSTRYNEWSDITEVVNALNQTTHFNYYDIGMLNRVQDANNGVTKQNFDSMNRQSSFTDANGNTTSFTYDLAGRIKSVTQQNGSTVSYSYNNQGYLSKTTNARGQVFSYEYDKLGQLTKTVKPEGVVTTTYDKNGNVLTKSDENGTIAYAYDKLNRVIKYTDVYGNILEYKYDKNSNLTKLIYPDKKEVLYTYDALNRLATVTDWSNRITSYTYDRNSRLIKTERPNGTYEIRTYDKKGQLLTIKDYRQDGSYIQDVSFGYDALGNIIYEGSDKDNKNYTYDNLNRIDSVLKTNGVNYNYNFDAQSNLLGVTTPDEELNMVYGDNNWLTSVNDTTITYDAEGNALNTLLDGQDTTLAYDSQNRLFSSNGVTYRYDVNNNRIALTEDGEETKFIINPLAYYSQVLMETDASGNIAKRYVYGIGLIGEETVDNDYVTYHYDYRGSTVALSSKEGLVTDIFTYGTYGELLSGNEKNIRFLYNGKDGVQTDSNGLYYMRARYYNPDIKRFINQDILLGDFIDSTTLNRYSYVNGNPVSLIDPLGLAGILTIYAHEDHSWISFYNYETKEFTTHGVYGNKDTVYEPNRELGYVQKYPEYIYKGHVSLSREISDKQQENLEKYIETHKKWSYVYNCSDFSVGAWKAAGQGKLKIYGLYSVKNLVKRDSKWFNWSIRVDNPKTLAESIMDFKDYKIDSLLSDSETVSTKCK